MTNKCLGSVQNGLEELTSIQNDDNNQSPTLQNVPKEEVLHSTHSFEWHCGVMRPMTVTCNKSGTVEDSLKKSSQFRKLADKNKHKELVVIRDGKALISHFPCILMQNNEQVTVKFVKAVEQSNKAVKKPKKAVGVLKAQNNPSCDLLMFHVLTKGSRSVNKMIRNPALRKDIHEVTVYAYKGENVKQALKRDGRFFNIIFTKNCALSCKSSGVQIEFSNLVDNLSNKTFQVILLNKDSPPNSQSAVSDEAYLTSSPYQPQPDSEIAAHSNETDLNDDIKPKPILQVIPNSKDMKAQLFQQFKDIVKAMNPSVSRLSSIQKLLRVEFGQSAQMCTEVRIMKNLMELSNSVCQVRVNGHPHGSGFLLFGCYVITNGHVIYDENRRQLYENVSVHFSYESVETTVGAVHVVEIVGFEYIKNMLGRDWALLRLNTNQPLPAGLLQHVSFPSEDGVICIIGHPYDGVKKIDPCLIVPSQKAIGVVARHYWENPNLVHLITNRFFEGVLDNVQLQKALLYESCFYFGTSGSPVFDKHNNVIAMHTGGYYYEKAKGEPQSVIEYGHPLPAIMERIIIQMVEIKKVDVLKDYLACGHKMHQIIMENVKKLVENRNFISFRDATNELNDIDLGEFCEFFRKDIPVPMDIE